LSADGLKRFRKGAYLVERQSSCSMWMRETPSLIGTHLSCVSVGSFSAASSKDDGIRITAMRNPWKEFKERAIGKNLREDRGGGHQRVATVVLKSAKSDEAPDVLEAVVSSIRRHERSRIDHRDRTFNFYDVFWIFIRAACCCSSCGCRSVSVSNVAAADMSSTIVVVLGQLLGRALFAGLANRAYPLAEQGRYPSSRMLDRDDRRLAAKRDELVRLMQSEFASMWNPWIRQSPNVFVLMIDETSRFFSRVNG